MGTAQWISGARAALVAGMAAAALACATGPGDVQYTSEGLGLRTTDGLQRVENWGFGLAFIKPGVDLARYDSVVIGAVGIAYKAPRYPAHVSPDGIQHGTYLLPPHTANAFKRYLQKALANEFGKSEGLVVTQRPTSNAIRVTSYIVDLVVYTPPYWGVGNALTAFLANRGEFTLILDLRDAESGAPLLRVGDRSAMKLDGASAYIPANPVSSAAAARRIFRESATRQRRRLDKVRALPEIPPAPKPARNGD
jgi:hypothetical protein